ncbi:ly49 inhibitory receptor 7 isoform X1 [Rattus norvegicus]|uniref:Immunoreceptor Ly49i7 n=1 Tax=Rattus norvegicus TaxID=10116 RepID=Q5MPP5_RAT|nr:Ly49 inhibitory receptor 7 [Rattus norvegicus]XP_038963968.1 ly49 inhibitory receptor 7 isoform X1 [Rattus norvegicus]AAV74346.1 immunoreceptor Ly49i7 [Rattus norvegicus]|eukprot:NP_001009500.1 immunoreceptor Ly49i7 [Rattus norvegicus]
MSEQEVTYSSLRFSKSSRLHNQVKPEETRGPREAGHRECYVPWHLIVIALGILCTLLLVTVAVLVTNIFQYSQENHELQETLNQHNCSAMQNDIDLKEEMLRKKAIECSPGNDLLELLNREQNRWYSKTKTVINSLQHTSNEIETHWFCYGIKCYYFIKDRKTWHGCKRICQNSNLSLLKIDDEDERKFLQQQVIPDNYWIGLSYEKEKNKWAWIENGPSELASNTKIFNERDGACVFLSKTKLDSIDCNNLYSCICGKRLNKFPDLLFNEC